MTDMTDRIIKFIFEDHAVRGHLVYLSPCITQALSSINYPDAAQQLWIESALATQLLSATIKFEGQISLQAKSHGPISLLVTQVRHDHSFRSMLQSQETLPDERDIRLLMPNGRLGIHIEQNKGQRYQGIVPLERASLAACIEDYFTQSEQLKTCIRLYTHGQQGVGILLQAMPHAEEELDFSYFESLVETLTTKEVMALPAETILHRLFHQDPLKYFDPIPIEYRCGCNQPSLLSALKVMSKQELLEIIQEEGNIAIQCEFCQTHYHFDAIDIEQLFSKPTLDPGSNTKH